ncbi:MAG: hypothetical protein ABH886_07020, partial [Candidatus Desantisbacteria bacterium]
AWFKIVHRRVTDDTEKNNPLTPFFKGELGKHRYLLACSICYPDLNHAENPLIISVSRQTCCSPYGVKKK